MSASRQNSVKGSKTGGPVRPRAMSLQRQTSIVEPAASIVGLPEIDREPSRISRHAPIEERRESESYDDKAEKDTEKVDEATYRAEEVTFPDGGLKVSHLLTLCFSSSDHIGMAMCSG